MLVVTSVGGKWHGRKSGSGCKRKEMLVTWFNTPFVWSGYFPINRLDVLFYVRKIPASNFSPDIFYAKWGFSWFIYFEFTGMKKLFPDVSVHKQAVINIHVSEGIKWDMINCRFISSFTNFTEKSWILVP